jgi:hypothetical protein
LRQTRCGSRDTVGPSVRAAKFKCAHHVHMPLGERLRKRPLRPYQGAWNTGGTVYDQDAETPRAVRAGNLREAKQRALGFGRPAQRTTRRWNPCSVGRIYSGGQRHCAVASLRITSPKLWPAGPFIAASHSEQSHRFFVWRNFHSGLEQVQRNRHFGSGLSPRGHPVWPERGPG